MKGKKERGKEQKKEQKKERKKQTNKQKRIDLFFLLCIVI